MERYSGGAAGVTLAGWSDRNFFAAPPSRQDVAVSRSDGGTSIRRGHECFVAAVYDRRGLTFGYHRPPGFRISAVMHRRGIRISAVIDRRYRFAIQFVNLAVFAMNSRPRSAKVI